MTIEPQKVLEIIRETRVLSLPFFGNVDIQHKKTVHAHDVVTEVDTNIEKFLREKLETLYPNISFFGEEFGGNKQSEKFWLCDPIDGTGHFVRGLPFCTTMIALIENGAVTFSAIYDFVNDAMYHAVRGGGSFCNNTPIHVSNRTVTNAYVGYESHIERPQNLEMFKKLRDTASLIKILCSGYEYALVASGKIEGRIAVDPWGQEWDLAPGSLLVSEAGGIVANIGSRTYDYRNRDFIAANPELFKQLTEGPEALFPISE